MFNENNMEGAVVLNITVSGPDVTLAIINTDIPFRLEGNELVATAVLDYEAVGLTDPWRRFSCFVWLRC